MAEEVYDGAIGIDLGMFLVVHISLGIKLKITAATSQSHPDKVITDRLFPAQ